MKLIKKPSLDKCNAMRCKTPTSVVFGDRAFCADHGEGYASPASESETPTLATDAAPLPEPEILRGEPAALEFVSEQVNTTVSTLAAATFVRELAEAAKSCAGDLVEAKALVIQDQEDFTFVEEAVGETKANYKAYEERRTSFTKPANAMLREFNSWFKPVTDVLKETEKVLKGELSAYRREQAEREQELIAAARAAETPTETKAALVAAATAMPTASSTSYVDNWIFEIQDEFALPRELLVPDERAIKAQVKLLKNKTDIPGVRVWNEPTVRSSSKKG